MQPESGQPLDAATAGEIGGHLAAGRKIEAVKVYRQATGASLSAAKRAVEELDRGQRAAGILAACSADVEGELVRLLRDGQKIAAIKLLRERTGVGLKQSKETVEALARRHGLEVRGGCAGVLAAIGLGLAAATALAVGR
jgi:ribosomal protein L7/L12